MGPSFVSLLLSSPSSLFLSLCFIISIPYTEVFYLPILNVITFIPPLLHSLFYSLPNPPYHPSLQEENHPVLTPEQAQLLLQLSQSQHHQGQVAGAASVHSEDPQQSSSTQSPALLTSPSKASLETLHQLLQLQLLQQQLNAPAAQPHSAEQTVSPLAAQHMLVMYCVHCEYDNGNCNNKMFFLWFVVHAMNIIILSLYTGCTP